MKKQILGMLMILLLASPVMAQEPEVSPGITPDQEFLWGLDMIMERVQIMLTFNQADKVMLKIKRADERLAEMEQMIEENKLQYMSKAEGERNKMINEVEVDSNGLTEEHRNMVMAKLQKHIRVLTQVQEKATQKIQLGANEQFKSGIDNAIDKSSQVIERMGNK